MAARKPTQVTVRAYQVGFGDCFLLTFHYTGFKRHVLIDFGSTGQPKAAPKDLLLRVARDIRETCGGKLHAVVATHRHKDHISGFATARNGKGPGDIIASCDPDVVIQPWTEDPRAQPDAKQPTKALASRQLFVQSLSDMHAFSDAVLREVPRLKGNGVGKQLAAQLSFLGEANLKNASAVNNLMKMGKRPGKYVYYGARSGLETILPGVKVTVLGPPTLKQSEAIREQRVRDEAEFWHFQAAAARRFFGGGRPLFPRAPKYSAHPPYTRWFVSRVAAARGEQSLEIVRALDEAMNNTSVILLFEIRDHKLLFPGDAQIENWSYALKTAPNHKAVRRRLADVTLYKIGHHGSLNATPKSLWFTFKNRGKSRRLQTVLSTMANKHGQASRETEVPRRVLVEAVEAGSRLFTTQSLKGRTLYTDIEA
jgi:hypothetical protein